VIIENYQIFSSIPPIKSDINMTSYSIKSETSQEPIRQPNIDNYQPEVDAVAVSDWESKMAKLVGFEEESPQVNVEELESAIDSLHSSESQLKEIPQAYQQPLASNPFAKLALVGSGTFAVVLVAGVFLTQIMSTGNQKPRNNITTSKAAAPPKFAPRKPDLEQEIETLKTKLALAEQVQTVTAAQQSLRTRIPVNSTIPQVNNRTTTPIKTAVSPRVVTVERIIEKPYSPQPVLPPVAVTPQSPNIIPNTTPTVTPTVTPPSPPDPLDEWKRLAKLGSYGQIENPAKSPVSMAKMPPLNNTNIPKQPTKLNPEPPPSQPNILISQTQTSKSVKAGTSAKAVLLTAIFGETTRFRNNNANRNNTPNNFNNRNNLTNENDENNEVFVVQLKEPLKSVDGAIALPAGTELLAQVNSISERGLLQLDVTKIVLQDNGQLREKSLPDDAISVRATQGKPLVANKFPNNSSSIAGMDTGLFVLGGVSKAAELLNRIDSQVTTNAGSTIVTNSNNQRNLAAGIVEGGLKSIVPQISQRNQQAINQMMQQTNVWLIPAGQEVEIYINRTMQL
jgi:hypothetical protein